MAFIIGDICIEIDFRSKIAIDFVACRDMLERLVMAARFITVLVSPARRCRQRGLLG